jgi:hypothetical protein
LVVVQATRLPVIRLPGQLGPMILVSSSARL